MDYGHWTTAYVGIFDPSQWEGFVYKITHLQSCHTYIGKKSFTQGTNWKKYISSSEEMKALIREHGKESCSFEILELCATKRDLTYTECRYLFMYDVLRRPKYLNKNILGKFYRSTLTPTKGDTHGKEII